ncbi:sucrose transport protein SUC3 isoform X2 [Ipomoea triloba]|uniref:sucrose transport protein SUC3 isoform X2 n=1 Tax=Ipomoea triloba TaxID=35885 RepID=UPI00125E1784|nr:sucrose transport protein SUC3 isoform X2 [Ipomoea triloba]
MMEAVTIKVPYRNLKQEVELVGADELHQRRLQIDSQSSPPRVSNGDSTDSSHHQSPFQSSLLTLILSCTVAAGVQFGWALQLSLLTPYIQTLGIQHAFSSFIWLCGPITGLVVQPCVGIWSDKCSSKYGRRRPFILIGSLMISISVIIIGFSADIGYILGDTKEHCRFLMLPVCGPARALLADLSGPDQRNTANAVFCSWMAVGNILGFSAGASGNWHRWFPFLMSRACCEPCGNLKAAFLIAVVFLALCTLVTLHFAKEVPLTPNLSPRLADSSPLLDSPSNPDFELAQAKDDMQPINFVSDNKSENGYMDNNPIHEDQKGVNDQADSFNDSPAAVLVNLLTSLRHLPPAMHSVLIVMALTWLSWFPFFLFDTDWMGREVYHGDPNGDVSEVKAYNQGVREGAFGLLLNSVVLGITSFFIDPLCQWIGARLVWAVSNFMVFICMAGTTVISFVSLNESSEGVQHVIGASKATKVASLVVFALLGIPLAITYSVPFSVTAELTADAGGGQGLAIGVLNLAIVMPQMIISLGAGPWDALFGGGNIPAFALASIFALGAGIIATLKLPSLSRNSYRSSGFHF